MVERPGEWVQEAAAFLAARMAVVPKVGVVLGSGLSALADELEDAMRLDYTEVPRWPASTVVGHPGRLVVGRHRGTPVVALAGRAHLYEGHDPQTVVFGVRVLGALGVKILVLTNAAGGINTSWSPGTLMLIEDHINAMGSNPLVGPNDEARGPRFPDMTEVYSRRLRTIADEAAQAVGVSLARGIYVAVLGPSYETPAEIRAFRVLGADAIGMSTVPEAIAARQMGMEVLGISCITNMAAGVLSQPLDHDEVMATAARVREPLISLLEAVVERV